MDIKLIPKLGKLLLQGCESFLRKLVVLFFQRKLFNLELHNLSLLLVHFFRHGIHFRLNHGTGLVHQVYCFIRKETVGDITVGKRRRRNEGGIRDFYAVEDFIALFDPS